MSDVLVVLRFLRSKNALNIGICSKGTFGARKVQYDNQIWQAYGANELSDLVTSGTTIKPDRYFELGNFQSKERVQLQLDQTGI